jgi:hypothetical protein
MVAVARPRFYSYIALAFGLMAFAGFARTFYLRYWFDVPPITRLLIVHGVVFTAWVVLFIVQTRLVAANRLQTHMRLGVAGVVLAILILGTGLATTIVSAGVQHPRPLGLNSYQFAFLPLLQILAFGGLVGAAVSLRHKPQLHRRLMTLAMIAVLGPAVARILRVADLREHYLLFQMLVPALFILWCLGHDWLKHRVVHPIYWLGGILIVLSWPARVWVAQTAQWEAVGRWMAGLT